MSKTKQELNNMSEEEREYYFDNIKELDREAMQEFANCKICGERFFIDEEMVSTEDGILCKGCYKENK